MTKEVQRSKYIHLINENSLPDYKGKKFLTDQEKDLFEKRFVEQINVRFCKPKDLYERNRNILKVKSQFFRKMHLMKNQGQNLKLMEKITYWLDDNVQHLY